MYEQNLKPLPPGDAASIFAEQLREIAQHCQPPVPITPEHVIHEAVQENQPRFASICRRLLLPGSTIDGWKNLEALARLARSGKACLFCLSHRSNLDVPTLYALLEDQAEVDAFHRIIWIAGRKLYEDSFITQAMAQSFNRIVLTPRSWFDGEHSDDELHEAQRVNAAAQREILSRRQQGWIFGLFPAGTRQRPGDRSTARAVIETDTYVKSFDHLALCNIDGCTLPVSQDRDYTHETPTTDRVVFTIGPVLDASQWRADAQQRFPDLSQRHATAQAIIDDINTLGP